MKIMLRYLLIGSALLTALSTVALASSPHKPAKMSCDEFLALDDAAKPKVIYWTEGFNNSGKPVDALVDVERTERLLGQLVAECKKAPTVSMFKKMADLVAATTAAASANASAPRPTKLTCEDFIALDDVVKPKVVYWAEGFNKKGKPVDSVVDVDDTDKLVPVLVEECRKAPKVTFWDKLTKHL